MTFRTHQAKRRIVEVPITFVERTAGSSKMSKKIVVEALWRIARWGIRARFTRRGVF
jgi:dolichol-phosphate mannosyltransferase